MTVVRPVAGDMDLFAQAAALQRVAEAEERTDARVASDATEEEIVRLLTQCALNIGARHYVDGLPPTFHSDNLGARLDDMGVPRENNVRRRLVSVCVNRGKAEGLWRKVGKVMGRAGREITLWEVSR